MKSFVEASGSAHTPGVECSCCTLLAMATLLRGFLGLLLLLLLLLSKAGTTLNQVDAPAGQQQEKQQEQRVQRSSYSCALQLLSSVNVTEP
jgi:hypothetical protein